LQAIKACNQISSVDGKSRRWAESKQKQKKKKKKKEAEEASMAGTAEIDLQISYD
jgi:hypothetical protein